uniref:Peptidase M28 domain-containing protein n=1 Tax=Monopterus albus TaxID=43700 RepID=A0A3Q3J4H3_MONAL
MAESKQQLYLLSKHYSHCSCRMSHLRCMSMTAEEQSIRGGCVCVCISDLAVFGAAQNHSYRWLDDFIDTVGNCVSGSHNLERAIKYMYNATTHDSLDVHLDEIFKISHWVKGKEGVEMIVPRIKSLAILGLGQSSDFSFPFSPHSLGAVAIRSITPFSINSPPTGWRDYQDGVKRIPTACITVEDAELMRRMAQRGQKIVVRLMMSVNVSNVGLVMDSDLGTFSMKGGIENTVMEEVVRLLAPINVTKLETHGEGIDISMRMQEGVPGARLHVADSPYQWFHHNEGDGMAVQQPCDMDLCSALWAVVAYFMADLQDMLPR